MNELDWQIKDRLGQEWIYVSIDFNLERNKNLLITLYTYIVASETS